MGKPESSPNSRRQIKIPMTDLASDRIRRQNGWGTGGVKNVGGTRTIADTREKPEIICGTAHAGDERCEKTPARPVHVRARRAYRWGATACCMRVWGRFSVKTNPSPRTNELANTSAGVSRTGERKISKRGNYILSHKALLHRETHTLLAGTSPGLALDLICQRCVTARPGQNSKPTKNMSQSRSRSFRAKGKKNFRTRKQDLKSQGPPAEGNTHTFRSKERLAWPQTTWPRALTQLKTSEYRLEQRAFLGLRSLATARDTAKEFSKVPGNCQGYCPRKQEKPSHKGLESGANKNAH